uniref:C-type lectin domain-containing protein n=1 Tax=Dicentrarchus labrax TaxID=13489 RepID=A0A8P4FZ10_DICLA
VMLQPPNIAQGQMEGQRSDQREWPCWLSALSWQLLSLLFAVSVSLSCRLILYCDLFKDDSCTKCEYGWEQDGRQCYYFSINRSTWSESRDECRQKGGDLVQIDSREEQVKHTFWIGLTDSEKEGTWLWVDGSPLNESLTFWNGSEPDNWTERDPDGEDCVRMGEKPGAPDLNCWFDEPCKDTEFGAVSFLYM